MRLSVSDDFSNSLDGFRNGTSPDGPTQPDYGYDLNGNMTSDWNKGIQQISYNHLDLPTRIDFKVDAGEKFISYIYNAVGHKVSKRVLDQSTSPQVETVTDYLGGYQYVNNILQFFPISGGYVSVVDGKHFEYVYNYTDHLGNIRLSYTREGSVLKVLEESHYYPFGMKHSYNPKIEEWGGDRETGVFAIVREVDRSKYQYKYNGKEYQDELSLNWYDYGARNYDPAIGRWMNIDPLAEITIDMSPYNYVKNNPIVFIDPNGMIWVDPQKADRLKEKIDSKISMINSDKAKLNKQLGDDNLNDKQRKKITEEISQMDSRISSLNSSKNDIDILGADKDNMYDLVSGDEINGVQKKDDIIKIQGPNDAIHVHEIKHVSLSLSSEKGLQFNKDGYLQPTTSSGLQDEIAAYLSQYYYEPSSLPASISTPSKINLENLGNLRDGKGELIYRKINTRYWNSQNQNKINKANEKKRK